MKYLISLSLRYIKRQKLRSILTFLSIVLSVFILITCSVYVSSLIQSLKNATVRSTGAWEVSFNNLLRQSDNRDETAKKIQNHAAVSDMFYMNNHSIHLVQTENTDDIEHEHLYYFNISFDKNKTVQVEHLTQNKFSGSNSLTPVDLDIPALSSQLASDEAYMPLSVKKYGYSIGDKISFTVTPVQADLDRDSEKMQKLIRKIKNKDSEDITDLSLLKSLLRENGSDSIPFKKISEGKSYTLSYTIKGFVDIPKPLFGDSFTFYCAAGTQDICSLIEKDNPDLSGNSIENVMSFAKMNDNKDIDKSINMVMADLGYSEVSYTSMFDNTSFNTLLLALEFKPTYILVDMLPVVVVILFLFAIAWVVSRFTIDNAFEISVSERSSQFALLRTLGASKSQIKALIFSEAFLYSITAIPAGTAAAIFISRQAFITLAKAGVTDCEFKIYPVAIAIGLILCITAIFISSYTSAVWASRKLSPAQALNFGKPSENKEKNKRIYKNKKRNLNKNYNSFILSYTYKNIFRTKKRFLISTIALSSAILMFTSVTLSVIYLFKFDTEDLSPDSFVTHDFEIISYNPDIIEQAEDYFADSELFSDLQIQAHYALQLRDDKDLEVINNFRSEQSKYSYIYIQTIDKRNYDKEIYPVTKITYEDFTSGKMGLFMNKETDKNKTGTNIESYKTSVQSGFASSPAVYFDDTAYVCICGSVFSDMIDYELDNCLLISNDSIDHDQFIYSGLNTISIKINTTTDKYQEASAKVNEFCRGDFYCYSNNYFTYNTGRNDMINAIIKILLVFIISLWLTGIVSMANSINTSVLNRQAELMMMRSVGMSIRQLLVTVITESILFSSFSTVIGTAAGVGGFKFFQKSIVEKSDPDFIPVILVFLLLNTVVNILIAFFSALPAVRNISYKMKAS